LVLAPVRTHRGNVAADRRVRTARGDPGGERTREFSRKARHREMTDTPTGQ